jgi:hypothetical protein
MTTAKKKPGKTAAEQLKDQNEVMEAVKGTKTKVGRREKKGGKLVIQADPTKFATCVIEGTTPMIQHKWASKAIWEMLHKQIDQSKSAKKKKEHPVKHPHEDFLGSMYVHPDMDAWAFTPIGVKKAMKIAAGDKGYVMTEVNRALFVTGVEMPTWLKLHIPPGTYPQMIMDLVRVGNKQPDIRFRGQFNDWALTFVVEYNADLVDLQNLANLITHAGRFCGIGERRPSTEGNSYGTFRVHSIQSGLTSAEKIKLPWKDPEPFEIEKFFETVRGDYTEEQYTPWCEDPHVKRAYDAMVSANRA